MTELFAIGPPERAALDRCTFCPKMCRFSCPVSHAERTETLTPWGKMTLVSLADAGLRALDHDSARALYGCSGCLRCRTYCTHQNDVPRSLRAGRAMAFAAGLAPEPARAAVETFQARGDAGGEDLTPALDSLRGARGAQAAAEILYFPGCDALRAAAAMARDALAASALLGAPLAPATEAPPCCGLPLLDAGDVQSFAKHAAKVRDHLGRSRRIVTSSARCARAFRESYPEVGVELGAEVLHVSTLWQPLLPEAAPLPGEAAYHDPCSLGRGLGETDAPRAIVAAALERTPVPAADAGCCGGAGLLPHTMPEVAHRMALELAASLGAPAMKVVTACPTCARSLAATGAEVWDLGTLVVRWLGR